MRWFTIRRPPVGDCDWLRTNCSQYCSITVQLRRKFKQTHTTKLNRSGFLIKRFSRRHRGQEHSGPPASGSNSKQDRCIGTNQNQSQRVGRKVGRATGRLPGSFLEHRMTWQPGSLSCCWETDRQPGCGGVSQWVIFCWTDGEGSAALSDHLRSDVHFLKQVQMFTPKTHQVSV